ncbi:MAG TPA: DUF2723 domain-containing protein [Gemmatimonadales bacterium]|nr:DUF2723 domain-containing protein [Gemmatimonadales bacterium]
MQEDIESRPPYLWGFATFAVIFVIYCFTLSPTTAFWDTSEYIAAAKILGIPHPPGNPLFTLMAHVWGFLPLAANYAKRINYFAAVTSAAGAGLWFMIAERWLRPILAARLPRYGAAFAGIFASAMAWTVWNQSTVNEKVYTVSLFSIALIIWCVVRWADQPVGERRDRYLVVAIYLLALTSTNHMMGVLGAPVVGLYVLFTDWRVVLRPRVVAAVVVVAAIGLSLNYVYLPMRAAQHPAINEGEPVCASVVQAVAQQCPALNDVLNRAQYGKPPVTQRMSPFSAQLSMYWQYWSWQWARDWGAARSLATGLFTAFAALGLVVLIRRNRRAGLSAAALVFTLIFLLIYYLNFRYGFSYHPEDKSITGDMREVRERDYFFIASFAFVGVLIAAGFAAAIEGIREWLGDRGTEKSRWIGASSVLALGLIPVIGNHVTAPRNHETLASDFAVDMLQSVAPYGILITAGDNDTFPLWFAQEVLGVRRDVTLANLSLMNTDWHLRQLHRRVTPAFDPAGAAPMWRNMAGDSGASPLGAAAPAAPVRPTTPALTETDGWLDSLPEASAPIKDSIQVGNMFVQFHTDVISRSDIAAFLLIRDNLGKRPIYFSLSDGDYPDKTLGLGGYLVEQGMVRQLMPSLVKPGGSIHTSPYFIYIDADKTRSLLFDVYHTEAAAKDRPSGWVDVPSVSILDLYEIIYSGSVPMFQEIGDSAHAAQAQRISDRIAKSIRQ